MEALCKLLTTVGKLLEIEAKDFLDATFERLKPLTEEYSEIRIKFMIKDVIDLREKNRWVSRRKEASAKKISEIHKETKIEESEKEKRWEMDRRGKYESDSPRYRSDRPKTARPRKVTKEQDNWMLINPKKPGPNQQSANSTSRPVSVQQPNTQVASGGKKVVPSQRNTAVAPAKNGTVQELNQYNCLAEENDGDHMDSQRSQSKNKRNNQKATKKRDELEGASEEVDEGEDPEKDGGEEEDRPVVQSKKDVAKKEENKGKKGEQIEKSKKVDSKENIERYKPKRTYSDKDFPTPSSNTTSTASWDDEEVERQSKTLISEFVSSQDLKEAKQCVNELLERALTDRRTLLRNFVVIAINRCVEMKDVERNLVSQLLVNLHSESIVKADNFLEGLESVFETIEDLLVDIPRALEYIAHIIVGLLNSGAPPTFLQSLTLGSLKKSSAKLIELIAHILVNIRSTKGDAQLVDLFQKSKLNLLSLLKSDQQITQFLKTHGLQSLASK